MLVSTFIFLSSNDHIWFYIPTDFLTLKQFRSDIVFNIAVTISIYDVNLTSRSWDWTNLALISSWQWMLSSRRKSFRMVYHFSINHNNAMFILWQLKIKASGDFFLSCCYKKIVNYFQTGLLYLKFLSNTVSGNTYWGRRTNISSN